MGWYNIKFEVEGTIGYSQKPNIGAHTITLTSLKPLFLPRMACLTLAQPMGQFESNKLGYCCRAVTEGLVKRIWV